MKLAKVIPLYKTGNQNVSTNYRSVSLLPQFSKILEQLFSEKRNAFIDKQNILKGMRTGWAQTYVIQSPNTISNVPKP